jgi:Zn-finger nucleic acid-binding protein
MLGGTQYATGFGKGGHMADCPVCGIALETHTGEQGMEFHCPSCKGVSIASAVLKRRGISNDFLRRMVGSKGNDGRKCPHCEHAMRTVIVDGESLTFCPVCSFLWTTKVQLERLPKAPPKRDYRNEAAIHNAEEEITTQFGMKKYDFGEIPRWRQMASIFFPIVVNVPPPKGRPIISYIMAAICLIDILSGGHLLRLIPATVTSFGDGFMGIYFFLAVAARLEERISPVSFLLLVIVPMMAATMMNMSMDSKGMGLDVSLIAILVTFGITFPFAGFGFFLLLPYKTLFGFRTIPAVAVIPFFLCIGWFFLMAGDSVRIFHQTAIGIGVGLVSGAIFGFYSRKVELPKEEKSKSEIERWL